MINRHYNLNELTHPGKVLVIYGPRRSGKTTLVQNYLNSTNLKYRFDNGENIRVREILQSQDFERIFSYVGDNEIIVIDEAQEIEGVGKGLKIIVDNRPNVRVIATGSSAFDLARNIGEPLVGRQKVIKLYPISQLELLSQHDAFDLEGRLEEFLIFGSYPDVLNAKTTDEKAAYLEDLVDSYLLKDILALDNIKSPQALRKLLVLLAHQVGSEVSLGELAGKLEWDSKTVARYVDLLEKCFIIKRLGGFSRNMREEVTRKSKYFFVDNGVRNALIGQFANLDLRDDVGKLWENFLVMERIKYRALTGGRVSNYFWRNYAQKEIDYIEEFDGEIHAYEFKWSSAKDAKAPKDWAKAYPDATFSVVNPENYLSFVANHR